jgi:hypothetical protein
MMNRATALLIMTALAFGYASSQARDIDLVGAAIVTHSTHPTMAKAAVFLQEEMAARTTVTPPITQQVPASAPAIVLELSEGAPLPANPEAYAIRVQFTAAHPVVHLTGRSPRGVLFAAGHLLRLMRMEHGAALLDASTDIATAPAYPIRGHQLGYRDTANAYDAWDLKQFEQYIRDLVIFGTNAIELIPSLDPREKDSPHMDLSMWDMTVALSELLDAYDLDLWLWLALDGDVTDAGIAARELEDRRKLFRACTRIDGVFVPGGDPGHTEPDVLMPWLEHMAAVLHETHPKAGVWVSNQGFTAEQNDVFFNYLEQHKPQWLAGVVHGPWAKLSLADSRARTPDTFPIRRYPDITHCIRCEFPVPQWDRVFAHTLGREPCNPRPHAMQLIHNLDAPLSVGFISYSDGINDDCNKILWSALGWNPGADVDEILADYGRVFFGPRWDRAVADGLRRLEANWDGPAATNAGIPRTFSHWQKIEQEMGPAVDRNWRMQLHLLRAYYDLYVQQRLVMAIEAEQEAMQHLAQAHDIGANEAVARARAALRPEPLPAETAALRQRLVELGALLFKVAGMQLDVATYKAKNPERGAVLEFLDQPLNDAPWLEAQFDTIMNEKRGDDAVAALTALRLWEKPAPGALYDDLGNAAKQPHLVRQHAWAQDPGFVTSPQEEFSRHDGVSRLSWLDQAQTLYGTPLRMRYERLDPNSEYRLRVTYAGRFNATMSLTADATHLIHGPLGRSAPIAPVEFALPRETTSDGTLDLEWNLVEGRGCQVAEVWLIPSGPG